MARRIETKCGERRRRETRARRVPSQGVGGRAHRSRRACRPRNGGTCVIHDLERRPRRRRRRRAPKNRRGDDPRTRSRRQRRAHDADVFEGALTTREIETTVDASPAHRSTVRRRRRPAARSMRTSAKEFLSVVDAFAAAPPSPSRASQRAVSRASPSPTTFPPRFARARARRRRAPPREPSKFTSTLGGVFACDAPGRKKTRTRRRT